jgi:hypothetical protein
VSRADKATMSSSYSLKSKVLLVRVRSSGFARLGSRPRHDMLHAACSACTLHDQTQLAFSIRDSKNISLLRNFSSLAGGWFVSVYLRRGGREVGQVLENIDGT